MSHLPTQGEVDAHAARMRRVLAAALYPAPEEAVLVQAARRLAAWQGRIVAAMGDPWDPVSIEAGKARSLLGSYRSAIKELGCPDRIAARLLQWAAWADDAAGRHEVSRADYAARVERQTGRPGFEDQVEQFTRMAAAGERCRDDARSAAAAFRAQAEPFLAAVQVAA